MAPTKTTTLRLSTTLRDEIARLAEERNTSMAELVANAIDELKRQHWWDEVRHSLNDLDDRYTSEASVLDGTVRDGLGD